VKLSREALMRLGADLLIIAAWVVALASLGDIDTRGEFAIAAGATLFAGLVSGRFRILILAVGGLLLAALLAGGTSCDPSTCEDDISPLLGWILLAMILAIPAAVMALGVLLRKMWGWHREDRRSWSSSGGSQPR
jgi:hypothetical protein